MADGTEVGTSFYTLYILYNFGLCTYNQLIWEPTSGSSFRWLFIMSVCMSHFFLAYSAGG